MIALSPYYASVFHTGFQRLMQDSGAHDLIVKSAVDFMFALAEGDYQQEVSLFVKICFNHAS